MESDTFISWESITGGSLLVCHFHLTKLMVISHPGTNNFVPASDFQFSYKYSLKPKRPAAVHMTPQKPPGSGFRPQSSGVCVVHQTKKASWISESIKVSASLTVAGPTHTINQTPEA